MYKLSLSPFWLVVFVVLAQSVGAMTIKCSCVLAGHGRPITSESSVTPLFIQQPYARDSAFAIVYGCFSRIKKMLGRTEMRTRERKYLGRIRSVWDISRGDRARIATCSLRTSTDRQTWGKLWYRYLWLIRNTDILWKISTRVLCMVWIEPSLSLTLVIKFWRYCK